jgi:hypothetical protein
MIGDLFLTLTYAGLPPVREQAAKYIRAYLRKLADIYRRHGVEFKYIITTEYKNKRIHHHIAINAAFRFGVSYEEIEAAWRHGGVHRRKMYSRNFARLAGYVVKETRKTHSEPDAVCKRFWSGSRNLIRPPDPYHSSVDESWLDKPGAHIPKGYEIDEDSVTEGENPYTGTGYIEYILVPTAERSKYRKRPGAKRGRARPTGERKWLRERGEYQLEMEMPIRAVDVADLFGLSGNEEER